MEGLSLQEEIRFLREENRRLKALLELREDRAELETFQVQSRNKLILLFVFTLVVMGSSWLYYFQSKAELNAELNDSRAKIKQMKATAEAKGLLEAIPKSPTNSTTSP